MRFLALTFLCCCLAIGGVGEAAPSKRMQGTSMTMEADCPGMAVVAASPSDRHGSVPIDLTKPDCCRDAACVCAAAHVAFATAAPLVASPSTAMSSSIAASSIGGYASPALARFVRPPIS